MILHHILYSRTLSKDYRWILLPTFIEREDVETLNIVYDVYDNYKDIKSLSQSKFPQIYCLNLKSACMLIMCRKTDFKDAHSRPIYSMEGVCVEHKEKKVFSAILQYLLDNYQMYLNSWNVAAFDDADGLQRQERNTKLHIEDFRANASETLLYIQSKPHLAAPIYPQTISFDEKGFVNLLALAVSSKIHLLNIAFGVTSELSNKIKSFEIIALLDGDVSSKPVAPERIAVPEKDKLEKNYSYEDVKPAPKPLLNSPEKPAIAKKENLEKNNRYEDVKPTPKPLISSTNNPFSSAEREAQKRYDYEKTKRDPLIPSSSSINNGDEYYGEVVCEIMLYSEDNRSKGIFRYLSPRGLFLERFFFGLVDEEDNLLKSSEKFEGLSEDLLTSKNPPYKIKEIFLDFIRVLQRNGWEVLPQKRGYWWKLQLKLSRK